MKKIIAALLLGTALVAPSAAFAKDVTITTSLANYGGNNAYLAFYVTKPDGTYDSTLWVSGHKTRYLGEMRGWISALQNANATISLSGITGASVGSGQTLTLHVSLADAMIDAGYQLHVDSAVEHGGIYADDAVIGLASGGSQVSGSGYVSTLSVKM